MEYSLETAVHTVTIEITDEKGYVARIYGGPSGDSAGTPGRPAGSTSAANLQPPVTAGRHRFAWDLRRSCGAAYPPLDGMEAPEERYPWAIPGVYQVRVTADGETVAPSFEIRPDPATATTRGDLEAQLALATDACNKTSEAVAAVLQVRGDTHTVRRLVEGTADDGLRTRGEALIGKLEAVEASLVAAGVPGASGGGSLPLARRLAAFQRDVAAADGRPSGVAYAALEQLSAELASLLERLAALERQDGREFQLDRPGAAQISFDTKGVEFGPWVRRFVAQVKRNWSIPYTAMGNKGTVVVSFSVRKSGHIEEVKLASSSGVAEFDASSIGAIASSNPTHPLPREYPQDRCFFTLQFFYDTPPR